MDDSSLTLATRLSLIQRARRILQSKGSRKRKSSERDAEDMDDIKLGMYTLEDFPEEESQSTQAPEVSIDGRQFHADSKSFFLVKPMQGRTYSSQTQSLLGVENYAIEHYTKDEGWPSALHAENSTFSTLFALIMWEIIYTPIPDVFRAPFQSAPLDLLSEYFYPNRRELIDAKLQWIRTTTDKEISREIEACWKKNFGAVYIGADWHIFPSGVKDVKEITMCLGQDVLANICELFSMNYRSSSSGLPDLILWNVVEKTFKFVEVKGPGDKLSTKQLVWLSRLTEWNCSVEVCRVRAA